MKPARAFALCAVLGLVAPFLLAAAQPEPAPSEPAPSEPVPASPPTEPATTDTPAEPVTQPTELPTPESLFDKHLEAAGGMDKIMSMHSRVGRGVFEQTGQDPARLTVWAQAPDKLHIHISSALGGAIDIATDGRVVWSRIVGQDPVELEGGRKREFLEAARFYAEAEYKTKYKTMRTLGKVQFSGRPAWLVYVESNEGRVRRLVFDDKSGLIIAERSSVTIGTDEHGKDIANPVEAAFNDWTPSNGVSWPMTQITKYLNPKDLTKVVQATVMRFKSLDISEAPMDHDFSMPAAGAPGDDGN